jgi:general secretion pathway protein F
VAEIRNEYAQLLPRMQAGASLSTASAALRYPGSRQLLGMISSGEGSGKLPELLERHARSEADWINGQQQQLATWLPRLVYAMLLIWLAYGAIGGFQALVHRPIE